MNGPVSIVLTGQQRESLASFAVVAWIQAKREAHRLPRCKGPRIQMARSCELWSLLWPAPQSSLGIISGDAGGNAARCTHPPSQPGEAGEPTGRPGDVGPSGGSALEGER